MLQKLVLACLSFVICSSVSAEELISWHESLSSARQISQQYKVPILIHFYGDQCMPCKTLEKNVFTRPEIASTMQRYFVPVRINATQDRRTAAEYGVHSWPTDVFVSPDGKVLSQGVCNQNPNAYLQNLQAMAVMNRDRNAMLAAAPAPANAPSAGAAPYGRTVSTNLQQSAPGRDQAPSPYSNPSSGPAPYAAASAAPSQLGSLAASALPSPQSQATNGQATNGLIGAGPLPNAQSMTLHPSQPGTSLANKDANLPPTVQWQTDKPTAAGAPFAQSQSTMGNPATFNPNANGAAPALASTATVPGQQPSNNALSANATTESYANPRNGYMSGRPVQGQSAVVNNPHYAQSAPQPSATQNQAQSLGQLASTGATRVQNPSPSTIDSKPTASVPALSGYCPVALFSKSQWVEGSTKYAIRHRGRIYFLSDEDSARQFLADPDAYSPVLSGHDPLVFLRDGQLIEGSIYDGVLKDQNRILLFSSEANKKYFYENYDRLIVELEAIINQSRPLTASAAAGSATNR